MSKKGKQKREQNIVPYQYKCESDKPLDAPLSHTPFSIKLEQPVMDVLVTMNKSDRISLVRYAIVTELRKRGLL